MLRRIYLAFGLSLFATNALYADISGTVFQDLPVNGTSLNTYGVKDSNELGVSGITVTAYPDNISTVTASDGSWSLATTQDSRIEFSNFPNYLQESPNGSAIMFVANGAVANFGLHDPSNYSSTGTPNYVTNRQQNGSGEGNTNPAIETVGYSDSGLNQQFTDSTGTQGTGPIPSKDSEIREVGSIWGKAYQKDQKRLFASSVLQRHIGFAPNKGAGDVYVLDYSKGTPATFLGSFSLQGVTPNNGGSAIDLGEVCRSALCKDDVGHTGIASDYVLNPSPATPNIDLDAFAKIGKMSYGDIDFEQSTNTLWLINLKQKGIISVDASGDFSSLPSTVNQYLIEDLNNAPTCTGGELRPWALSIHQGRGYLGAVCDALTSQNSADMQAYVLSFDTSDPAAGFKEELSFPLNYNKDGDDWNPWSDTDQKSGTGYWSGYYQPILSDIEFDASNTMYLSFLDRYGLQAGYKNYEPISGTTTTKERTQSQGELLRACFNLGNYELEGTGSCTQTNYRNEFLNDSGGDGARDYANGTLALLKGSNQIVVGLIDPHPEGDTGRTYWSTMGANILSTQNGSIQNWYSNIHTYDVNNGYNGKSQGMGDIELLTDAAPIEVGDRVWEDTNSNGVQDYNESGLAGISVELVCGGVVSSTATTDENGNYIFSSDPIPASTPSHKYNVTDLVAGTNSCLIRVPNVLGASKQATLGIATLTVANSGEGVNANSNDSDGLLVGDDAEATILASDIPISGANNHAFDFGFRPKPVVSIGSLIWEDLNKNGLQDDTEPGIKDVNVTLLDENGTVMSPPAMQTTGVDGQYYFSGLNEGDYSILVSPPSGMGYVPCVQQTTADNDDTENDSNIKSSSGNEYTSGKFTLQADTEPSESNGMSGTDDADDSDDDNGNMTVDFCFYRPASLGDYVWYDENKDGIQDASEHGVKDITVKLLKDCNDATVVGTTTTDNEGKYLFSYLDAGDYCVEFSNLPADTMVTTKGVGTATDDSDASTTAPFKTDMITLSVGQEDFTWDMGIYSSLVAIGDRVWYDLNKNGQQDVGESGVKDIAVKLLDATCTNELNTTTTDGTGNYIFDHLREGTYCLEFGTLPDSYVITTQDAIGSDEEDSDVNASTHKTIPVTLSNGARDLTWDMGIYAPVSLGDRVWNDSNANGVQDAGEVGV
ncbi:MAG: hypothetical protein IE889_07095, partial [Campylobacterales bacterium]|nr:hypothetical protein [Campylobacterales bacterium]